MENEQHRREQQVVAGDRAHVRNHSDALLAISAGCRIDRQPDGDHYFTQCRAGTFIGDISMFTGEPTLGRSSQHEGNSTSANVRKTGEGRTREDGLTTRERQE